MGARMEYRRIDGTEHGGRAVFEIDRETVLRVVER